MYGVRVIYLATPRALRNAKWGETIAMVIFGRYYGVLGVTNRSGCATYLVRVPKRLYIRHVLSIFDIAINKKLRQRPLANTALYNYSEYISLREEIL